MSTVLVIKNGVIIEEVYAFSSYKVEGAVTVKPRNEAEMQLWRQSSENTKKIEKLKEEIRQLKQEVEAQQELGAEAVQLVGQEFSELFQMEHEKYCPGELHRIQSEWDQTQRNMTAAGAFQALTVQAQRTISRCRELKRSIASAQLEEEQACRQAVQKAKALREKITAMERMKFQVQMDGGMQETYVQTDRMTEHGCRTLHNRLDQINSSILSGRDIQEQLRELEALEQDADGLPAQIQAVFEANVQRAGQADRVQKRLVRTGWKVKVQAGSMVNDNLYFYIKNESGDRATLTFTIRGEINIDSVFQQDGTMRRRAMHRTVMEALAEGGAQNAHACCTTGEDPDIWAEDISAEEEPKIQEDILDSSEKSRKQVQQKEVAE